MTRYRLPEALGGGEVEVLHGMARDDGRLDCDVPGVGVIAVPFRSLTEVVPPLPSEPDVPGYCADRRGFVWQNSRQWTGWQCGIGGRLGWSDLWEQYGPLTRLVPDPFAEPVKLPWVWATGDYAVSVNPDGEVRFRVGSNYVTLREFPSREAARALWAAAEVQS